MGINMISGSDESLQFLYYKPHLNNLIMNEEEEEEEEEEEDGSGEELPQKSIPDLEEPFELPEEFSRKSRKLRP